jgi:2-hydroxy-3-keto-5-methylthiopentenyl-1-phosphate phosphatase
LVYVGDGLSDRCVAARADLLFAKAALASHCLEHQLPYTSFESFDDVRRELASLGPTRGWLGGEERAT